MTLLLNGDCLELMEDLDDDSVDLIFCDLPYVDSKGKGQTSCHWNQSAIDLELFWKQVMRIKKLNTPIFMTTTTKFGVELINSAPKKCHFRYDIVWVKSSLAGFLCAKKMPMRKHEMIYVFYEKLPFYDLSSHQHKFLEKEVKIEEKQETYKGIYSQLPKTGKGTDAHSSQYDPPLPVSVVKEIDNNNKEEPKQIIKGENNTYNTEGRKKPIVREKGGKYETPLPVSVVKEETGGAAGGAGKEDVYGFDNRTDDRPSNVRTTAYDPPLPNSMLEIKSTRGKHSTEKPVALMEWILKYYSKEGDVVLDPTMGSGSTGVACKNMNRNFIGFEMDAEIYDGAVNRLT